MVDPSSCSRCVQPGKGYQLEVLDPKPVLAGERFFFLSLLRGNVASSKLSRVGCG